MRLDALLFDPLLPLWLMVALALAVLAALAVAVFWRLTGWPYRGFAVVCVFLALLNPSLKTEERQAQADIVIVVVDRSSSQALSDRAAQTEEALAHVTAQLADRPGTEMRLVEVEDAAGPGGSEVMTALAQALSETAQDRIAGAIVISDGQIHDPEFAPKLPAPLHLLLTGRPRGTGTPAASNNFLLNSLSCAIDSAIALLVSVSAACMRRCLLPQPNCTRLASDKRR